MTDSVREFVLGLVQAKAQLPEAVDIDTFDYVASGFIDSVGLVKFVLTIEASYDIEILEADILSEQFRTVGGLVALIEARREPEARG